MGQIPFPVFDGIVFAPIHCTRATAMDYLMAAASVSEARGWRLKTRPATPSSSPARCTWWARLAPCCWQRVPCVPEPAASSIASTLPLADQPHPGASVLPRHRRMRVPTALLYAKGVLDPIGLLREILSDNPRKSTAQLPTAFPRNGLPLFWHTFCTPAEIQHRETRDPAAWAG